MITQIHFLLTYECNFECDHCFLYSGPKATGTFTLAGVKNVLREAKKIGTVEQIYFEGGEPFLYYPILAEGLRQARALGFKTGVVTNSYWATTKEDAILWLKPLVECIGDLRVSDDSFHHGEDADGPARIVADAAASLGLSSDSICIEKPAVRPPSEGRGEPVVGGDALFKGRAVEKLTNGLPAKPVENFTACLHEELVNPKRVHVDAFGNVHVCQGLSIGNMWRNNLSEIIGGYDAPTHPICGPIAKGGPVELAKMHKIELDGKFVDECHYCYLVRRKLADTFPEYLSPRQVYGLAEGYGG